MNKELADVLEAKEQRWNKRLKLSKTEKCTVISISLCVPLKYRTNEECKDIFYEICRLYENYTAEKGLHLISKGKIDGADGPTIFYTAAEDAVSVKKISVEFESLKKPFRITDIDIMNEKSEPIGRESIGLAPRKCFICDNDSAVCVKAKTHTKEEMETCIKSYFCEAYKIIK